MTKEQFIKVHFDDNVKIDTLNEYDVKAISLAKKIIDLTPNFFKYFFIFWK